MERTRTRLRFSSIMFRFVLAAALLAAPLYTSANVGSSRVPYLPVPKGAAVILNTGSTNTSGYRIVVQADGSAEYVADSGRATATVSSALAAKFFADLKAAGPLGDLPSQPCMKSVSFGTSLFVWWKGGRSPDLTCPAGPSGSALSADAADIAHELHVASSFRRPVMRPLLPGEEHAPMPASPSPTQSP
jgi:hypothetical protein